MSYSAFEQDLKQLIKTYGLDDYVGLPDYVISEFVNRILRDLRFITEVFLERKDED